MSQSRRLAAILAADVAGYSRLMGADEEGTLAALKAIRRELSDPKVKEHRGRIVKTTGDGLLVEFASVVDAVRCAVEVQRGMAERNALIPQGAAHRIPHRSRTILSTASSRRSPPRSRAVVERAVETVGPNMRARRCVDQLAGDAHLVAPLAHRAFEYVAHAKFARHLLYVDGSALIRKAGIAGDHKEPRQVAGHVLERQYRDRRLFGQCHRRLP